MAKRVSEPPIPKPLTNEELAAITQRDKMAPGRWHSDCCGAPVLHYGYCESLINMIPKTCLYVRAKRGERFEDEMAKFTKLNEQLRPLFAPAYQAHNDVTALLGEVKRLKQHEELLRSLVTLLEAFWSGDGMDHDPVLKRAQALVAHARALQVLEAPDVTGIAKDRSADGA